MTDNKVQVTIRNEKIFNLPEDLGADQYNEFLHQCVSEYINTVVDLNYEVRDNEVTVTSSTEATEAGMFSFVLPRKNILKISAVLIPREGK